MRAETGATSSGMPPGRRIVIVFGFARAVGALVYVIAVTVQLVHSIGFWSAQDGADIPFLVLGFFSYFTMQTGSAAAVLLGVGAWLLLSRSRPPRWFVAARALLVTYAVTTALAYAVLLRPIEVDDGSSVPWSNEWLHLIGPLYLLLDWVVAPDRRPLRWRTVGIAAIYPIAWAAYTFARGPGALDTRTDTNWYPYPFLNPETSPGGYASALGYVAVLATAVLAVAALVVLLSRYGRRIGSDEAPEQA
ncbi:Pr6Pr family membrane protein [Planctomonas psychrotolerans]|uniref:Pr6Pr family membrane protein n=1 Tax=Planctomonas psychrotolerans TaxID=2528712 RepID=UPI00123A304F|nr:Pr6Pr family membrane protein [Planctomonas psychrotolerans]